MMKKLLVKKRKGAALLTAILLSSIVGAVAIGVSALAVRQVNISETYNNGLIAFYSAESGLEEGLLRYRFDKDAQIPFVINATTDPMGRTPARKYRSLLDRDPMNSYVATSTGNNNFYLLSDRKQVYDLQVYYKQKYYGDDVNKDGYISRADFLSLGRPNSEYYKLAKDEQKDFTITGSSNPSTENRIYLFWRWSSSCAASKGSRALEVKLKVDTVASGLPADRDEYTALFKDTTCASAIANADIPVNLGQGVFTPIGGGADLKSKMNILSLKVVSMSLKSIGGSDDDHIAFGFNQGNSNGGNKVAGPTTTVRSLGYFGGVAREITANINRQSGTILDIFNYVIYKGE
jgi:hypothetical protein